MLKPWQSAVPLPRDRFGTLIRTNTYRSPEFSIGSIQGELYTFIILYYCGWWDSLWLLPTPRSCWPCWLSEVSFMGSYGDSASTWIYKYQIVSFCIIVVYIHLYYYIYQYYTKLNSIYYIIHVVYSSIFLQVPSPLWANPSFLSICRKGPTVLWRIGLQFFSLESRLGGHIYGLKNHAGVCHCQLSAKVELANIDPMYQYSLQWFLDEPCGLPQRLSRRVILQCSTTVWWAEVPAAVPACRGSITKIWCAGGQEQKLSARINVQDIKNHSSTFRPTAKVTSEKYEK